MTDAAEMLAPPYRCRLGCVGLGRIAIIPQLLALPVDHYFQIADLADHCSLAPSQGHVLPRCNFSAKLQYLSDATPLATIAPGLYWPNTAPMRT